MRAIIAAYDQKRSIGAHNDLLWQRDLPADLRRFKELTTSNAIIMGRKTFDSMQRRPLPSRTNIVISRAAVNVPGVLMAASLEAAYNLVPPQQTAYVIGGALIFQLALPTVERLYITEVLATFSQATVFFPRTKPAEWQEISRQHHEADERNKYAYDFVVYQRTRDT